MEPGAERYRERAARILRDTPGVRLSVTGAALHFDAARRVGYDAIEADAWRRWAEHVKSNALTHLGDYLEEAERNLRGNGVQVHWAEDAGEAVAILTEIVRSRNVRRVVKGKSMLSEELGVNAALDKQGVEVYETDLGEYILQLLDESPSHILGPAIHRSLDDIRELFADRFGTPLEASPETLAGAARRVLREAFLSADLGITGANFVVAETGTVALIENEGNIRLSTSLPRVHVALVGIEKLLPRWSDLAGFLQLTARAATGQSLGSFVTLVHGPRRAAATDSRAARNEPDGPEEVHVVFVDNGRTGVLADPDAWEVLRCVRCGACLNACPVYRQTGGHAYGSVYSGPLGAVLNPGLLGLENAGSIANASTLCGACFDVCPVRIPIPTLLLKWRRRSVAEGRTPAGEARTMKAFSAIATRPVLFRMAGRWLGRIPSFVRRRLPGLSAWSAGRATPVPSPRSFLRLWQDDQNRDGGDA